MGMTSGIYVSNAAQIAAAVKPYLGAWQLVAGTTLGTVDEQVAVPGLDLNTDLRYYVQISIKWNSGTNGTMKIFANADETATNYEQQNLRAYTTTVEAARANTNVVTPTFDTNDSLVIEGFLTKNPDGYPVIILNGLQSAATSPIYASFVLYWLNNVANLTTFTVKGTQNNSFTAGSYVRIYKTL